MTDTPAAVEPDGGTQALSYPRCWTLLTRAYCHLCDDMRAAVLPMLGQYGVELLEVDIDAHPALEARFGELVPVLLDGDTERGRELCHHFLDVRRVLAALSNPLA
jgi:hypothetical protein